MALSDEHMFHSNKLGEEKLFPDCLKALFEGHYAWINKKQHAVYLCMHYLSSSPTMFKKIAFERYYSIPALAIPTRFPL